jgi:hypothetical protein
MIAKKIKRRTQIKFHELIFLNLLFLSFASTTSYDMIFLNFVVLVRQNVDDSIRKLFSLSSMFLLIVCTNDDVQCFVTRIEMKIDVVAFLKKSQIDNRDYVTRHNKTIQCLHYQLILFVRTMFVVTRSSRKLNQNTLFQKLNKFFLRHQFSVRKFELVTEFLITCQIIVKFISYDNEMKRFSLIIHFFCLRS